MRKRKIARGFTLIECLVALAVLGIVSLLLVQSFTQLAYQTRVNSTLSNSIANQMSDAEDPGAAEAGTNKVTKITSSPETFKLTPKYCDGTTKSDVSIEVDVYAVNPYKNDAGDTQVTTGDSSGTDVRYLYFHP